MSLPEQIPLIVEDRVTLRLDADEAKLIIDALSHWRPEADAAALKPAGDMLAKLFKAIGDRGTAYDE